MSGFSKTADFLIISNPNKLSIYNQFEQSLSSSEKEQLLPYSPFQIVTKNELLGDQITEALRGIHEGSTYYILRDGKNNFKGDVQSVLIKTYTQCTLLQDTVKLKNAITLKSPSGQNFTCNQGEALIRIFQSGSSYYIRQTSLTQSYGWYTGSADVFRFAPVVKKNESDNTSAIESSIQTRLETVNKIYKDYFEYFNSVTRQEKSVPHWKLSKNGKSLQCTLVSSDLIADQLQQSTRYIVQEIEQVLLGKPFTVDYHLGEITIKSR